ncbi:formin-like protein 3 [Hordeum vulgare]|uniref:Uncharacterized protein n=1 Tax=Hordeum vulgare subsp. vulgare TaxID=112509 RepID=A0A8I6XVV7_HORVV|nr:E3 ubiquitin-protein ligase Hakai-like [Hordeum vulgare subsp. vulgare]KAE8789751.1 formin-like protein 3 [Hordeum vulgare]
MADCYAPDMDELRWLPREIFADIGIADAAPPSAAAVEDVAVHLTGILVSKEGLARPPPPPPPAPYHRPHAPQVSAPGGTAPVVYGGGSNGGGVPAPWPALPYSPPLWQVPTNFANGGGSARFLGPRNAPLRPSHGPPPTKRRLGGTGGTGVFLPRAQAYQYQHKAAAKSPAKGRKPPKELLQGQHQPVQQQQRGDEEEATKATQKEKESAALLALPQEWTY